MDKLKQITGMSDNQIDKWTKKVFFNFNIPKRSNLSIEDKKTMDSLANLGKVIINTVYKRQMTEMTDLTFDTVKFDEDAIEIIDCIFKDIPINIEKCKDCLTQCINYKKRLEK